MHVTTLPLLITLQGLLIPTTLAAHDHGPDNESEPKFCCTSSFQVPSCARRNQAIGYCEITNSIFHADHCLSEGCNELQGAIFSLKNGPGDVWVNILAPGAGKSSWVINSIPWMAPKTSSWIWAQVGFFDSDTIELKAWGSERSSIRGVWRGTGQPPVWESLCALTEERCTSALSLEVSSNGRSVQLNVAAADSVLVYGVPSSRHRDPVVVRSITGPSSLSVALVEPACHDQHHVPEAVSGFISIPSGVYETGNGIFQAGKVTLEGGSFQQVKFPEKFPNFAEVVVVATLTSSNGPGWAKVRVREVTTELFELDIEGDAAVDPHVMETVSWVATSSGQGTLLGARFEAQTMAVGSTKQSITFTRPFDTTPIFLASVLTTFETDSVAVRTSHLTNKGVSLFLDESVCFDAETFHVREDVGWIAMERLDCSGAHLGDPVPTPTPQPARADYSTTPLPSIPPSS